MKILGVYFNEPAPVFRLANTVILAKGHIYCWDKLQFNWLMIRPATEAELLEAAEYLLTKDTCQT